MEIKQISMVYANDFILCLLFPDSKSAVELL